MSGAWVTGKDSAALLLTTLWDDSLLTSCSDKEEQWFMLQTLSSTYHTYRFPVHERSMQRDQKDFPDNWQDSVSGRYNLPSGTVIKPLQKSGLNYEQNAEKCVAQMGKSLTSWVYRAGAFWAEESNRDPSKWVNNKPSEVSELRQKRQ